MIDPEWYRSFFQGVALDLWQKVCPPELTLAEVDCIERLLLPSPKARLLDIPCGMGRHSLELSRRGYHMTSVDISSEALGKLKQEAQKAGGNIDILEGDMKRLQWFEEFDGAFCMGNSFGYLDRAGTLSFVQGISRALKPGGRFLLDTSMIAESILPTLDERNWVEVEDILFLIENDYRVAESCLATRYTFHNSTGRETRTSFNYVYTFGEISHMLQESGLSVVSMFESLDLEPFHLGSHRLLLLAEKDVKR